jgi:hypothetical protein
MYTPPIILALKINRKKPSTTAKVQLKTKRNYWGTITLN